MCLIRLTKFYCGHHEVHKINHCETKLGRDCPKAKASVCRHENRSCLVCKLQKGAVMGSLSMAGAKAIIKAGKKSSSRVEVCI